MNGSGFIYQPFRIPLFIFVVLEHVSASMHTVQGLVTTQSWLLSDLSQLIKDQCEHNVMMCFSHIHSLVFLCIVSEPTLKWKIKKLISTRPNPLQRKISAPSTVKHRTETLGRLSTLSAFLPKVGAMFCSWTFSIRNWKPSVAHYCSGKDFPNIGLCWYSTWNYFNTDQKHRSRSKVSGPQESTVP